MLVLLYKYVTRCDVTFISVENRLSNTAKLISEISKEQPPVFFKYIYIWAFLTLYCPDIVIWALSSGISTTLLQLEKQIILKIVINIA